MSPKSSKPRKPQQATSAQAARRTAAAEARRGKVRRRWAVASALLVAVLLLGIFSVVGGDDDDVTVDSQTSTTRSSPNMATECPAADGSSPQKKRFDGPPPMCIDTSATYTATMETTKGTLTIALDPLAAPATVNNFVVLARYHYFDDVTFHRIIPGFVIQGGDPEGNGRGGPGYKFADELPQPGRYELGSLAMANSGPNTNGSQFFIISGPQGMSLPPQYSLFGKVVNGLEVVAALDAVGSPGAGTPREPVKMTKVTIAES